MKLKFESNQQFQIDAVNSIVDIFEGQPLEKDDFAIVENYQLSAVGQQQTQLGSGNNIALSRDSIFENFNKIQDRNDLDRIAKAEFETNGNNFSVEMETGTGKTYVYLRTIFELSRKYGFKKYIIVVPSVAIREGTLKNIEITEEHFKSLFNNIEFEYFVYDSKKASRLRHFASSNHIQIMIINIDAFRKDFSDSEDERKSNVIFKENDKLSGRKPIEFVQEANPIVIIDEPQSVDNTPKAQEAIKSLTPLCIFRYSATHRNLYNLVYRLDPIKSYEMNLVKQIVVASVVGADSSNDAYVKLLKTDNRKGIVAEILIHQQLQDGPKEKKIKVKPGADLFVLSNEREIYRSGYEITSISCEPNNEFIDFSNGRRLRLGQEMGGIKEEIMEIQIRNTIQKHLDKEIQLKGKGIKVLSLFFIDRVSNYRIYDLEGRQQKGRFALWFEKHYNELIKLSKYKQLISLPAEVVHDGYFSQDKKGILKDTDGTTLADNDTYAKIMKNKEQLLSLEEPLKFIFSHSALREGWDNPNVFQICTLNETRSVIKKRQEIGRGLRLPVNQDGIRVFDKDINKLLVVANESYDDFARSLQKEYEDECGVTFGKIPRIAFSKIVRMVYDKEMPVGRELSEKIWEHLASEGFIDSNGKITSKFTPHKEGFTLRLSDTLKDLEYSIIDVVQSYRLERHIKNDDERKNLRLKSKKELAEQDLDKNFEELWNRIKFKTTYEVRYSTEELVRNSVKAIAQMPEIEPVKIAYREDLLNIENKGITSFQISDLKIKLAYAGGLPDVIGYLQKETELTRKTLVRILVESKTLSDFLINPQKFMDAVAGIINRELHRLIIDGIKYERIAEQEWSMQLFENKEILAYLTNRLEVRKSIYDAIVYESEIERKFAEELDRREDIKLFVKLPRWFKIDTPIGEYNPDWAIVKHEDETIYLVRETKSTKKFEQLRCYEADKIKCGRKHFEVLNVNFDVATLAGEV